MGGDVRDVRVCGSWDPKQIAHDSLFVWGLYVQMSVCYVVQFPFQEGVFAPNLCHDSCFSLLSRGVIWRM